MKAQYTTLTSNSIFKYRRKTPKELQKYIEKKEIVKSLGKNLQEANSQANDYTLLINSALELSTLSSIPNDVKEQLIYEKLSAFTSMNKAKEKSTAKQQGFIEIAEAYLKSLSVVPQELRDRQDILLKVFPSVFKVILKDSNPPVANLKHSDLVKARDILKKLPKRNISKYRCLSMDVLISKVHKGSLEVKEDERISLTTLNKYLKALSSLCIYAVKQNYILFNPANGLTIKQKVQARDQRKSLSIDELKSIDKALSLHPLHPLFKILRYTGMRLSEVLKCQVKEIDGVLCFDLRTPNEPLKTFSSYRAIPVHKDLSTLIDDMQRVITLYPIRYMSKLFTDTIHKTLEDTKGKSLYSLRHTFATTLIAKGIQPEVVSELMGHAHSTMTMNRYVKGYPIKVLKEAIDRL